MKKIYSVAVVSKCILALLCCSSFAQERVLEVDDPVTKIVSENYKSNVLPIKGTPLTLKSGGKTLQGKTTGFEGATAISATPSGFGFNVGLSGDYLFDFDKHSLKPEAKKALQRILGLYKDYGGAKVQIEGHTDSKGSDDYNLKLSIRRAKSVEVWLVENGIASNQITSKGFGEEKPVAQNTISGKDNPEGRALNRRVEIRVTTSKKVNNLPIISKGNTSTN